MEITRSPRLPHPRPHRLEATAGVSDEIPQPGPVAESGSRDVSELWRDYGINPAAMVKRAFVERPPADGTLLKGGRPAHPVVIDALRRDFAGLLSQKPSLEGLEKGVVEIGQRYGVRVALSRGVPLVNWDGREPAVLDVQHSGGPSAFHEMVHAVQCVIGGASALGTAAAEEFARLNGRHPRSLDELGPFLRTLSPARKAEAMATYVKPMESQAYSCFEETAFHATGLMGKRAKDKELFRARLGEVAQAFIEAYAGARVPSLETKLESKIYGGIGHIARTNGETALLLGGAGLAYHQLARQAMRIHPVMAVPVATPLAYLLYRAMVSG